MKAVPSLITVFALVAIATVSLALTGKTLRAESATPAVERGRNFVRNVGMCIDCHSPRNERGEFIAGKDLTGAPIGFAPIVPMPAWAPAAPALAGLPGGYTEQDLVQFLTTGVRPHGLPPARPPMPAYRISGDEAAAVAAYLKSLAAPSAP